MTSGTTPQKKGRLSNLFGGKKSKEKDLSPNNNPSPTNPALNNPSPIGANHDLHPSTSTADASVQQDSAYASSNHPSSNRNSLSNGHAESSNNADIVPVQNNGNIEGVDADRNLAYNTSTGQVVDDDTGQVVVTTTTTTTTTINNRGQKKDTQVQTHTQRDNQPTIAEAPGDMPSSVNSQSPVPPHRSSPNSIGHSPVGYPTQNNNAPPFQPPRPDPNSFPVPERNPMREREPMDPVSPLRPNFSYPSRTDIRDEPMPQQPTSKSTFANLKAAAQGLHGVGETVRGTFNQEIDSRFPRSNSQKAAVANAKNQAVLEQGNTEMGRLNMRRRSQEPPRRSGEPRQSQDMYQAPLVNSPATHDPMPQQLLPGQTRPHQQPSYQGQPTYQPPPPQQQSPPLPPVQQHQQLPPPSGSEPPNSSVGTLDNSSNGGTVSSSEMSQMPNSFSPESSAPQQRQGGLRKLMKRRPVGST